MQAIRLQFLGAAKTVTGSKYLLEVAGKKLLVEAGLFQGRKELRLRNWDEPPFNPAELDAVVLTHAHIDHTGYLPLLVRRGFKGPVYCSEPTKDLLHLLLPDSAHLQEEEAAYANKHGTSRHKPAKPLYRAKDAAAALKLLTTLPWNKGQKIFPGIAAQFRHAGHILGAATLMLELGGKAITFSGDIGRYDVHILPDPEPQDIGDLLLCESTYGDREHGEDVVRGEIARIVNEAVERGGPLIIPAFAVGRTQNILYYLAELEREGVIPTLPVFVDSPMAVDATSIYRKFKHDYDDETYELVRHGKTPLLTDNTVFCRTSDESRELNRLRKPRIVISASGMVTGGRILHHMKHWLDKEETTVLFVGYQADGTRGQTIQSGTPRVRIFGKDVQVRAAVETISGLSAHADKGELLRWLRSCKGSPKQVRIVHGEPSAAEAFSKTLQSEFKWDARPAEYLETVEV